MLLISEIKFYYKCYFLFKCIVDITSKKQQKKLWLDFEKNFFVRHNII